MYSCLCRPLSDTELKGHALKPGNLCKNFAALSEEITGLAMQCGKCEEAGDETLDELRASLSKLESAGIEEPA